MSGYIEGAEAVGADSTDAKTAATGSRQRSSRPRLHRALWWALAGALWGALSLVVRGVLSDHYFNLLGIRLGEALQWLMPLWWTARIDEALGIMWPGGNPAAILVVSTLLGAEAALALWWVVEQFHRLRGGNLEI